MEYVTKPNYINSSAYVVVLGEDDEDDKLEIVRLYTNDIQRAGYHKRYGKFVSTRGPNDSFLLSYQRSTNAKDGDVKNNIIKRSHGLSFYDIPVAFVVNPAKAYKIAPSRSTQDGNENFVKIIAKKADKTMEKTPNVTDRWFITRPHAYTATTHDGSEFKHDGLVTSFESCHALMNRFTGPLKIVLNPKFVVLPSKLTFKEYIVSDLLDILRKKDMLELSQQRSTLKDVDPENQRWFATHSDVGFVNEETAVHTKTSSKISTVILNVRTNAFYVNIEKTILSVLKTILKKNQKLLTKGKFECEEGVDEMTKTVINSINDEDRFYNIDDVERNGTFFQFVASKNANGRRKGICLPETSSIRENIKSYPDLKRACKLFFKVSEAFKRTDVTTSTYADKDSIIKDTTEFEKNNFDDLSDQVTKWMDLFGEDDDDAKQKDNNIKEQDAIENNAFFDVFVKWVEVSDKICDAVLEKSWKSVLKNEGVITFGKAKEKLKQNANYVATLTNTTKCAVQLIKHYDYNIDSFLSSVLETCLNTVWNEWVSEAERKKKEEMDLKKRSKKASSRFNNLTKDFDFDPNDGDDNEIDDMDEYIHPVTAVVVETKPFVNAVSEICTIAIASTKILRRVFNIRLCDDYIARMFDGLFDSTLNKTRDVSTMVPNMIIITDVDPVTTTTTTTPYRQEISGIQRLTHRINLENQTTKPSNITNVVKRSNDIKESIKTVQREANLSYFRKISEERVLSTVSLASLWCLTKDLLLSEYDDENKDDEDDDHQKTNLGTQKLRLTDMMQFFKNYNICDDKSWRQKTYKTYLDDVFTAIYRSSIDLNRITQHEKILTRCATYHPSDEQRKSKKSRFDVVIEYECLSDSLPHKNVKSNTDFCLFFLNQLKGDVIANVFCSGLDFMTHKDYKNSFSHH